MQSLLLDDALELIQREAEAVPYERVYYALRRMRVNHVYEPTVETMRLCLALQKRGLRVTVPLIGALRKRTDTAAVSTLHTLGDKKCLTLIRGSNRLNLTWIVSPEFLRQYDGASANE